VILYLISRGCKYKPDKIDPRKPIHDTVASEPQAVNFVKGRTNLFVHSGNFKVTEPQG
jgi:hypothetical protein